MGLSHTQFDLMTNLEAAGSRTPTQRELAAASGRSVGTVNKTLKELQELGYVQKNQLTPQGLAALEPYRAKRAVFVAAGFGSRMVPITLNTPKPLVRVNGTRMIDTLLDAVVAAGIQEIYIVRGYLAEQFDQLLFKYPMIKFIENPAYNEAKNIASLMCARYLLQNAYVLEADLVLHNPGLITKYQYCSNYLGVPVSKTEDWCFHMKNGYIARVGIGGENCMHMFGISYWTAADGARLAEHLKAVFDMPGGKEREWDLVPLEYFINEYKVEVRECTFQDICEIDTFRELKAIDPTYDVKA